MKRDMELVRKILLAVEEQYKGDTIYCLKIDGYEKTVVAEHCHMLYEYGMLDKYKAIGADNIPVITFYVGNMTWEGYDFLEKVREESIWTKTKNTIAKNRLPMVIDVIKTVASSIIEGAIKGII